MILRFSRIRIDPALSLKTEGILFSDADADFTWFFPLSSLPMQARARFSIGREGLVCSQCTVQTGYMCQQYIVGTWRLSHVMCMMALRVWVVLGPDTHFF